MTDIGASKSDIRAISRRINVRFTCKEFLKPGKVADAP
jgi:hypothetical protein